MVRDWGCPQIACVNSILCRVLAELLFNSRKLKKDILFKSKQVSRDMYIQLSTKCGYMYMKFKFSMKINNFSYISSLIYLFLIRATL